MTTPTPASYGDAKETAPLDPQSFDLAAWIEGVNPVRHAVTIYQRGDLVADLDVVKARLNNAKLAKNSKEIAALTKQARGIVEIIEQSSLDVVVEGWSEDRVKAFREPLKEQGLSDEEVTVRQVAAQVVSPEGFTAEFYQTLLGVVRPQAEAIAAAAFAANVRVPVVSVPS
jgi:acylphosphatase